MRHKKYKYLFARTVGVLILAFKILKVIKESPSTFSWRTTIPFFGDLIGSVFSSGLAFRLVAESSWQQSLSKISNGEYVCTMVMPSKKDIFSNWAEKRMCGDYYPVNWKTKSDRYPIPIPEELFDAIGFSRAFSTLDFRSIYH